jgi:hypothetical protein
MTKQEVLKDIDKLCEEIDKWTFVRVTKGPMPETSERLLVSAHQELSFLMDYIEENVKEDDYQKVKMDSPTTITPSDRFGDVKLKKE